MQPEQPTPSEPLTPISEKDLAPIKPLTSGQVLSLGQKLTESGFKYRRAARVLDGGEADEETSDNLHYEDGRMEVLREVLTMLGQQGLISKIDRGLNQVIDEV